MRARRFPRQPIEHRCSCGEWTDNQRNHRCAIRRFVYPGSYSASTIGNYVVVYRTVT